MKKIISTTILFAAFALFLLPANGVQAQNSNEVVYFETNEKAVMLLNLIERLDVSESLKTKLVAIVFASAAVEQIDAEQAQAQAEVKGVSINCADADCGIGDGAEPLSEVADESQDNVVRPNDSSGKMISIYGGEEGREVLNKLMLVGSGAAEGSRDYAVSSLLQQILLNRWQQLAR